MLLYALRKYFLLFPSSLYSILLNCINKGWTWREKNWLEMILVVVLVDMINSINNTVIKHQIHIERIMIVCHKIQKMMMSLKITQINVEKVIIYIFLYIFYKYYFFEIIYFYNNFFYFLGPWSEEEDKLLIKLVEENGP